MLATADHTSHYGEQMVYESEWTENIPTGISWLNLLTAQSIPEETDAAECPNTPLRTRAERDSSSSSSSSSAESCYVVLEIQRPRSTDAAPSTADVVEKEADEEEEEEEEMMEEEIEELNFAQPNQDVHRVEYDQSAIAMTIEMPKKEQLVEFVHEQTMPVEEHADVTQPIIEEVSNEMLFRQAKAMNVNLSSSSDEEPAKNTKLKTIRKVNEYHPRTVSSVAAEQRCLAHRPSSQPLHCSITSLDSIEKISPTDLPRGKRNTTTFSHLSSQRAVKSSSAPRPSLTMGTATLTRTFAFDRACMEKFSVAHETKPSSTDNSNLSDSQTASKEEIELAVNASTSTPVEDTIVVDHKPPNALGTPFYLGGRGPEPSDASEIAPHRRPSQIESGSQSLSKASAVICLMKRYARSVSSEYRLAHQNEIHRSAEPTLLQVNYLDGRRTLKDDNAREQLQRTHTLSSSISSRLNRLGLPKVSSAQDLSLPSTTASMSGSFRKRMFSRFRSLVESTSAEQQQAGPPPLSRPWQQKTIGELFSERKYKVNQ